MSMFEPSDPGLAKRIVQEYRARGFPARVYRGKPYLLREQGWEGPLDPLKVQAEFAEEIRLTEQAVRAAVAECFQRAVAERELLSTFGRDLWFTSHMTRTILRPLGFSDEKAKLYEGIALSLNFRGELWNEPDPS